MKPIVVNLFEGEQRSTVDNRLKISSTSITIEYWNPIHRLWIWEKNIIIAPQYYPAIIEALKQVSEGKID